MAVYYRETAHLTFVITIAKKVPRHFTWGTHPHMANYFIAIILKGT